MPVNKPIQILLIEPSLLIAEGLTSLLNKQQMRFQVSTTDNLDNIELQLSKGNWHLLIINPALIQYNPKTMQSLKNRFDKLQCIALVYSYFDERILAKFDETISIYDTQNTIASKLEKLISKQPKESSNNSQEVLSERETDVLKLLATGLSNKEIADKLHISIHTVISHRKNITQKTGIKSVSGLTIYAVVQKIISTESIQL